MRRKLSWLFGPSLFALALVAGCSRSGETNAPAAPAETAPASVTAPAAAPERAVQVPEELLPRLSRPYSPVLGPSQAAVTIVEFLDPACEACRAFAPLVKQIQFLHPEDVRVIVRFASFHRGSEEAIRMLMAAQRQKKFETVLAALFDQQEKWASHHAPDIAAAWQIAAQAGLDVVRARRDAASDEISDQVRQDNEDILMLQVSRTPTFYMNGKLLTDYGVNRLLETVSAEVKSAAPAR